MHISLSLALELRREFSLVKGGYGATIAIYGILWPYLTPLKGHKMGHCLCSTQNFTAWSLLLLIAAV